MMARILFLALLFSNCVYADEPSSKAIQRYDAQVNLLRSKYSKELKELKEKALKELQKEMDDAMRSKDLDKALALRDMIENFDENKPEEVEKRIPRNAVSYRGNKYAVVNIPMTPAVAARYAQSLGGSLLKVDTDDEFTFITKWMERGGFKGEGLWIGGSDEYEEGNFIHSDGSRVNLDALEVSPNWRNGDDARHLHWLFLQRDKKVCNGDGARHPSIIEWDN